MRALSGRVRKMYSVLVLPVHTSTSSVRPQGNYITNMSPLSRSDGLLTGARYNPLHKTKSAPRKRLFYPAAVYCLCNSEKKTSRTLFVQTPSHCPVPCARDPSKREKVLCVHKELKKEACVSGVLTMTDSKAHRILSAHMTRLPLSVYEESIADIPMAPRPSHAPVIYGK